MSYWENCAGMANTWQWLSYVSHAAYQDAMLAGNIKKAISLQKTAARDAARARDFLFLAIDKVEMNLSSGRVS